MKRSHRMAPDDDESRWSPPDVVFPPPDVRAIRKSLGLTQSEFARRFGLSYRTVQQWEQRRSPPQGPAEILLRVIECDPEVVERAARRAGYVIARTTPPSTRKAAPVVPEAAGVQT